MKRFVIHYIAALLLVFIAIPIVAQQRDIEFDKKNFPDKKEELKTALNNIKEGDNYFIAGRVGYPAALEYYLKANTFNPNNSELNYKIGLCYFGSINRTKCLDYFLISYQLNPHISDTILFLIGMGYHLKMEFDEAINYYKKFKNILSPAELKTRLNQIDKKIEECNNGKELIKNPVRVWIDNLGAKVNSSYREYSPLISTDESMLIFTSRRPNTTGGKVFSEDNMYYEDIYVSYNINKEWTQAVNMPKPINTDDNDATVGISPDGQKLLIFYGAKNGGDIYECSLKGSEWSKPQPLPKTINTPYHEADACFSYTGKTLYFSSTRPDLSYGQHDIFMSTLDRKGEWGEPVNLGNTINTPYNERGVFMHPDGRTIYFSSDGHKSMGGLDIFKSTMDDNGKWSEPENLGYPINTPDDDVFFVMAGNGRRGYYSAVKDVGFGEYDLYKITFLGPEKPLIQNNEDNLIACLANPVSETAIEATVPIVKTRLTIVKGIISDAITKKPIEAQIEIVDNEKNEIISTFSSNGVTGKYLISLPSGKNYGIAVKANGYLFHSENFDIPPTTAYQEITKDIELKMMKVGEKIVLRNIFFDYAKATLRPESSAELDRLTKLLQDNASMKIEIGGHTDNQGSLTTNQKLSESRAKAVVDYLISKGIDPSRLSYKGYAFNQPIAPNDTDAGRQLNRRVEFKIMGN